MVNSCANDIQHTENNKRCQRCKHHWNRFLSASAWSSPSSDNFCRKHCLLTSLLMCCSSHLHGKQFLSVLNKITSMHIYISEFVIPLCCRYQVVLSCTCMKYIESITDATIDLEQTENNKQCLKCKLLLQQVHSFCIPLFSDNFCRKHCLMT